MYKNAHAAIRADPVSKPKEQKDYKPKRWVYPEIKIVQHPTRNHVHLMWLDGVFLVRYLSTTNRKYVDSNNLLREKNFLMF